MLVSAPLSPLDRRKPIGSAGMGHGPTRVSVKPIRFVKRPMPESGVSEWIVTYSENGKCIGHSGQPNARLENGIKTKYRQPFSAPKGPSKPPVAGNSAYRRPCIQLPNGAAADDALRSPKHSLASGRRVWPIEPSRGRIHAPAALESGAHPAIWPTKLAAYPGLNARQFPLASRV